MGERIETIARALDSLNARVSPAFLVRFDHWLLVHHPLAWRARIHWIGWWSLLVSACAATWGAWPSHTPARAPTAEELAGTSLILVYASLVACVLWVALQLQTPLAELGWRRHLRLLALNAVAVRLLFVPARAFVLASTYRVANAIPDAIFESEYAFARKYDFWRCGAGVTQAVVDSDRAKVVEILARFGLTTSGIVVVEEGSASACLHAWDDSAHSGDWPTWLVDEFQSVEWSKSLWRHGHGEYFDSHVSVSFRKGAACLLLALGLGLLSQPGYVWRRTLLGAVFGRSLRRAAGRAARSHSRFGHTLLLRRPILWAARIHSAPLWALLLSAAFVGLVCVGSFLGAWEFGRANVAVGLFLAAFTWPYSWLVVRRHDVAAVPTSSRISIVGSILAAVLPSSFLLFGIAAMVSRDLAYSDVPRLFDFAGLVLVNGAVVFSASLIRNYQGRLVALLSSLSVFIWGALAVYQVLALAGTLGIAVGIALARRTRPVSALKRISAICVIVAVPAGLGLGWIALSMSGRPGTESVVSSFSLVCALVLATSFTYFVVLSPFIRVLARAEYEPKAE